MAEQYAFQVLQRAIGQTCETVGFSKATPTALEQLTCLTRRYIREITLHMVRCGELANRSQPTLNDLAYAFDVVGVDRADVLVYARAAGSSPLPFPVPRFPLPRPSTLLPPATFRLPRRLKRFQAQRQQQQQQQRVRAAPRH